MKIWWISVLQGFFGFYKGIVASYMGISETVVHFVIYEAVKNWLITHRSRAPTNVDDGSKTSRDFLEFMAAGAFSKTIASCIAYPHGKSQLFDFYKILDIYKFFVWIEITWVIIAGALQVQARTI